MAEVTKEDLNRIYNKLDPIAVDVAGIKKHLELLPKPLPRPCTFFNDHIQDHKAAKRPIIAALIDLGKMAIVAIMTYLFTRG